MGFIACKWELPLPFFLVFATEFDNSVFLVLLGHGWRGTHFEGGHRWERLQ